MSNESLHAAQQVNPELARVRATDNPLTHNRGIPLDLTLHLGFTDSRPNQLTETTPPKIKPKSLLDKLKKLLPQQTEGGPSTQKQILQDYLIQEENEPLRTGGARKSAPGETLKNLPPVKW